MRQTTTNSLEASFRDPAGFLFWQDGVLHRQVNLAGAADYDRLVASGLYAELTESGRLVPHTEVAAERVLPLSPSPALAHKILVPERIPFISYPYEWSFGQLKAAALATLAIQKRALRRGLSLKDASAYNIQFRNGRATLIDTLSFEQLQQGEPWTAYRQYCMHFLAPLALMARRDIRLGQLLRVHLDGIPLDLTSRLLPPGTRWDLGLATHIHLHARAEKRYAGASLAAARRGRAMDLAALEALVASLQATTRKLTWEPAGTEWGDYYQQTNYEEASFEAKKQQVAEWTRRVDPSLAWDLGANTGVFSRLAADAGATVVSWDIDPAAVELNWRQVQRGKESRLLPLLLDLTNPSPSIGWNNRERDSLGGRGPVDLVLALALIHHLAISNNLPFGNIAAAMAGWGRWLVIEFVPKSDSQVQKLLRSRKDIFPHYDRPAFEAAFGRHFELVECREITGSERWLYLMKAR